MSATEGSRRRITPLPDRAWGGGGRDRTADEPFASVRRFNEQAGERKPKAHVGAALIAQTRPDRTGPDRTKKITAPRHESKLPQSNETGPHDREHPLHFAATPRSGPLPRDKRRFVYERALARGATAPGIDGRPAQLMRTRLACPSDWLPGLFRASSGPSLGQPSRRGQAAGGARERGRPALTQDRDDGADGVGRAARPALGEYERYLALLRGCAAGDDLAASLARHARAAGRDCRRLCDARAGGLAPYAARNVSTSLRRWHFEIRLGSPPCFWAG
jgi:hypothetical protein